MSLKIENETYLTVSEAAFKIDRATQTIYQNWKKKWKWKPFLYGSTLLFQESKIEPWLESQIIEGAKCNESNK